MRLLGRRHTAGALAQALGSGGITLRLQQGGQLQQSRLVLRCQIQHLAVATLGLPGITAGIVDQTLQIKSLGARPQLVDGLFAQGSCLRELSCIGQQTSTLQQGLAAC